MLFLKRHTALFFFGALLVFMVTLNRDLPSRLSYPPTSEDQEKMYLPAGQAFAEHFVFFGRAPVYSAWLGTLFLASGRDLRRAFYLDKFASVFLLSFLVACLGWQMFDARTGLVLGIWILESKYLILESNGSHAVAASLFVAGALCLFLPRQTLRIPAALLLLFLAAKTRAEMSAPLALIVGALAAVIVKRAWSARRLSIPGARYWLTSIMICVGLSLLFSFRIFWPEPHQVKEALAMNFAMNYVDRNHLNDKYSKPGEGYPEIWAQAFPGISPSAAEIRQDKSLIDPLGALRTYPGEIAAHVSYNVKLAVRALPAMLLAFDRPFLMLLILLTYTGSYFWGRNSGFDLTRWRKLSQETRLCLMFWAGAACSLILISLVFRVVSRYYIQLLPVQLLALAFAVRALKVRIAAFRS